MPASHTRWCIGSDFFACDVPAFILHAPPGPNRGGGMLDQIGLAKETALLHIRRFVFSPIQTAGLSSATASNKRQRRAKLNVQRQINRCPGRCFLLIHVKSLGIFWRFFKCSRIE
jgi:hypothetical protein